MIIYINSHRLTNTAATKIIISRYYFILFSGVNTLIVNNNYYRDYRFAIIYYYLQPIKVSSAIAGELSYDLGSFPPQNN